MRPQTRSRQLWSSSHLLVPDRLHERSRFSQAAPTDQRIPPLIYVAGSIVSTESERFELEDVKWFSY